MSNKNRYNPKLFLIGFLTSFLRKFPLHIIAVILAVMGIRHRTCSFIALGCLILAIVLSLIQQLRYKYMIEHNSNPDLEQFAKAAMSDNWHEEIMNIVNEKIAKSENNTEG